MKLDEALAESQLNGDPAAERDQRPAILQVAMTELSAITKWWLANSSKIWQSSYE